MKARHSEKDPRRPRLASLLASACFSVLAASCKTLHPDPSPPPPAPESESSFDRESTVAAEERASRPRVVTYDGNADDSSQGAPAGDLERDLLKNGFLPQSSTTADPDPFSDF